MRTVISSMTILVMFLAAAGVVVLAAKEARLAVPALGVVEQGTPDWQMVHTLGLPNAVDTFRDAAGIPMRRCDYGSFLVYIRGGLVTDVFYLQAKEGEKS